MKKLLIIISIFLMASLVCNYAYSGDDSVTSSFSKTEYGVYELRLEFVGDSSDGTVANYILPAKDSDGTAVSKVLLGKYLYSIEALPTDGGTAPDPASVFITDKDGLYMLGSEDAGTTAYNGLNLIHATATRIAFPNMYIPRAGSHLNYFPMITGDTTIIQADQATVSADWTLVLIFIQ